MWPAWYQPPEVDGPGQVVANVARIFGVTASEIRGPDRTRRIVGPRWAAIKILRDTKGLSYASIGRMLGHRDHQTIRHGYYQFTKLCRAEPDISRKYHRARGLA